MSMDPLTHRKANARLRILNPDGTPAAGRTVSVRQISHQFLFDCGAFDTVKLMKMQDETEKAFLQERMESWLGYALQGLIHGEWETRETLRADGDGCVSFAGFKGNYVLETGSGSAALSLESDLDGTVRLSR